MFSFYPHNAMMSVTAAPQKVDFRTDPADVTDVAKPNLSLTTHFQRLWERSSVPFQDVLESVVLVCFVAAWHRSSGNIPMQILVVALGFILADFVAPALSTPLRYGMAATLFPVGYYGA